MHVYPFGESNGWAGACGWIGISHHEGTKVTKTVLPGRADDPMKTGLAGQQCDCRPAESRSSGLGSREPDHWL